MASRVFLSLGIFFSTCGACLLYFRGNCKGTGLRYSVGASSLFYALRLVSVDC